MGQSSGEVNGRQPPKANKVRINKLTHPYNEVLIIMMYIIFITIKYEWLMPDKCKCGEF